MQVTVSVEISNKMYSDSVKFNGLDWFSEKILNMAYENAVWKEPYAKKDSAKLVSVIDAQGATGGSKIYTYSFEVAE